MRCIRYLIITIFFVFSQQAIAKIVKYDFDINVKTVNFTGNYVQALAINNQLPGPTITALEGDTLQVTFHNKMNVATSIHWHGILLPAAQDGVPYLNTQSIAPHSSHTFRYKVRQHGTYWYHGHTGLQEQKGVYGSIVFYPKNHSHYHKKDYVVVLSDWNDENPEQVLANLKKDGDYYALKKDSVPSWYKIIHYGWPAVYTKLYNARMRRDSRDVSDVGYDLFLSNGKNNSYLAARRGDKIRVRLINGSSSSYFDVEFAGGPMQIVAADGVDIVPMKVQRLRMSTAETYDVIVPIKTNNAYELRATSIDGTGKTSVFIGKGHKVLAKDIPRPNLLLPKPMALPVHKYKCGSKIISHMTDYQHICALHSTKFTANKPHRKIELNLTGNMDRYVWSFNHAILTEKDRISIKKGEIVTFVLHNKTMMQHPIHLHGHFFRVLNQHGNRSPLKHTVNVPAMDTVIIEFAADAEKDWFFHCHNLYHLASGMARIVSYSDSNKSNQDMAKIAAKLVPNPWYYSVDLGLLSNMTTSDIIVSNARNSFELDFDHDYDKEYDAELVYIRSFTRFLDVYAGADFSRDNERQKPENVGVIGFRYVLPMLINSDFRIDSTGKVRLEIGSTLQLTSRVKFDWTYNTDDEYQFNLTYAVNKRFSLIATYDSDFDFGAGFKLMF